MNQKTIQIPIEYKRLFDRDWREAAVYGGRFSLKSHTVARFLLIRAMQEKTRVLCGREFQNSIGESSHQLLADLINKYELTGFRVTENSIVNTVNGSDFIFKGLHRNEQSIKSIEGIDIAWIEEAQTISKTSIEILTPTVRKPGSQIIYTYNRLEEEDPVHVRLVVEGRPNTLILNLNYDIGIKYGYMPSELLLEVEDDKEKRPALYKHKWLGMPNTLQGRIYNNWAKIDEIPHEARLERYGVDFGYSVDPTVIVALYYYNGGYIIDEIAYQKGLSNKAIADILDNQPKALVVADSAEPKSIDEIYNYGINIIAVTKGADSVEQGIGYVKDQQISITSRSVKTYTAYLNYKWGLDKEGRETRKPDDSVHEWSNSMDAVRYAFDAMKASRGVARIKSSAWVARAKHSRPL
jgi:phage terminase large subunit